MFQFLRLAAFCLLPLAPMSAAATEAEDLARLTKTEFLAEFDKLLEEMLLAQKELFARFDPELAETAVDTGPATDAERVAVACLWDTMRDQGQLEGFAQQWLTGKKLVRLMSEQPELDIVDFFLNPKVSDELTADVPDEVLPAMSSCGSMKASAHRIKFSPELWEAIGAAGAERGYDN